MPPTARRAIGVPEVLTAADLDLVVVGMGYVGLPLAVEAAEVGLSVAGLEVDGGKVAALDAGRSHIGDIDDDRLRTAQDKGLRFTCDPDVLGQAATVVICVPTPLRADHGPDLSAVTAAGLEIGRRLRSGTLVVLESTTYPGTTEEILRPLLEEASGLVAGRDFHLAFSPERIDPGNERWTLRNTPKVVGGFTPACADAASAFYGRLVEEVVRTRGTREAEMAKLLENTYRHVNIALVNEMAVFCHELGVDLWDAIAAARTKPFGFEAFYPGPGVGGHCIPIDPNYLSYKVRTLGYPFRFVELAQEINGRMPAYVVARVQGLLNDHGKPVKGSRILLLGVTYKPDVGDERESPALPVGRRLRELGAELAYHDPFVESWHFDGVVLARVQDVRSAVARSDITVLLQVHRQYDMEELSAAAPLLFDARGQVPVLRGRVERL